MKPSGSACGSVNLSASAGVIADKLGDDALSFWLYVTRRVDLAAKQINDLRLACPAYWVLVEPTHRYRCPGI